MSLVGNRVASCQCGRDKVKFTCPKAFQAYNKVMGYMDLVDYHEILVGVCSKGKFQEMVQAEIPWFNGFHYCEQQNRVEYVGSWQNLMISYEKRGTIPIGGFH